MKIKLHKNARTTLAIHAMIQRSKLTTAALARQLGITENTVRSWRRRDFNHDVSSARHNNPSSFSEREEHLVYCLRVMNHCINPALTESSMRRYCRRLGVGGRLKDKDGKPRRGVFDPVAEPGFLHLDVKHLTNLKGKKSYVYVAIDRATRYVYVEVLYDLRHSTAAAFLSCAIADIGKHGAKIHTILTDNGFE